MRATHWIGLSGLLLSLSGCATYSLEQLRQTTPQGTPFQQALSQRYLDFASRQEKAYDWFNSMRFADKGLMSAYGKEVAPEVLSDWTLPADVKPALQQARAQLVAALTPEAEARQPEVAADAQINFDCWVTYQEPNWQQDKISHCRDGLREALAQLTPDASAPTAATHEITIGDEKHTSINTPASLEEKQTYRIFFEMNHSDLTEEGKHIIDSLANSLSGESSYDIVLNGHTDTTGSQEYNLKLSQRRAQSVKNRLLDDGIEERIIKLFAFGKSDPLVKTGDQMAEAKNRRVEIMLDEKK